MVHIKGRNMLDRTTGYYNTDNFDAIKVKDLGTFFTVCAYVRMFHGDYELIMLCEQLFHTKEEAEKWVEEKVKEWGIKLSDPNL